MQYHCAEQDWPVESEASLPAPLVRWVDTLRDRGLADLADLLVGLLQVWGFVGGHVLWMVAPLLGSSTVASIAQALEDPQALDALAARTAKAVDPDTTTGVNG